MLLSHTAAHVHLAWFNFRAAGEYYDVTERECDLDVFEFLKK